MTQSNKITNYEDVIDSRDVIERIDYLQTFEESELDESENEELKNLLSLQEEAEGYSEDWKYGSTLIRDSYFVEYAEELVRDIGDLPQDLPSYIENNIDWEGVADAIKEDYTNVDFDGVEYWIR